MKCESVREKLSEYIDGALESGERAALESHLAQCAACRRELQAWRRTVEAIKGLPRHSVPTGFAGRVMGRLRAEGAAGAPARRIVSLWPRVAAVAAGLLLAVGVILLVERGRPSVREGSAPGRERRVATVTREKERFEDRLVSEEGKAAGALASEAGRRASVTTDLAIKKEGEGRPRSEVAGGALPPPASMPSKVAKVPDQILTIVTDDPVVVAARAVLVADGNSARALKISAPTGEEAEIVISLDVPGENYERFLFQVVEITPPQFQSLSNNRMAAEDEYFKQVSHAYVTNQERVVERWEAAQEKKPSGGFRLGAAGGKGMEAEAPLKDMKEAGEGVAPGPSVRNEAEALKPEERAEVKAEAPDKRTTEVGERLREWPGNEDFQQRLLDEDKRAREEPRAPHVPREVSLVIRVVRRVVPLSAAGPHSEAKKAEESAQPAEKPAVAE